MAMLGDMRLIIKTFLKFLMNDFQIEDHNVPTLEQMMDLVMDVREWLRGGEGRKRVVALHCKGGKGRTGTMVCAILIDQDLFKASNIIHIFSKETSWG